LGETSVWHVTVGELTGSVDSPGSDPHAVALIKHDARMAKICERAVWTQMGRVEQDLVVPHAGAQWTLGAGYLTEALERSRATCRTWDAGRKSFEQSVVRGILRHAEERTGRPRDNRWVSELKSQPALKQFLDAVWPRLNARQVLRRIYDDATFRASVCTGLLTADESDLLRRGKGAFRPSAADIVLLDEIQAHLRRLTSAPTYGHIVVDEAQDLSPMQCRAIARRCPSGSMTVLGDLAQGTTSWAATDWERQMEHLVHVEVEHTELIPRRDRRRGGEGSGRGRHGGRHRR
jgi:hypothetical protein